MSATMFRQCGVSVDYRAGTITLPRGDIVPVSHVRGLRWEDYPRAGFYQAFVEVDELKRPLHPVLFATAAGPEAFVARVRIAIEKAGGPRFVASKADNIEIMGRDFTDPIMAAVARGVVARRQSVAFSKAG